MGFVIPEESMATYLDKHFMNHFKQEMNRILEEFIKSAPDRLIAGEGENRVMDFRLIDCKEKYEEARLEIDRLNAIIEEKDEKITDLNRRLMAARGNLTAARDKIRQYEMVIRAIEAVTGKNIMTEEF